MNHALQDIAELIKAFEKLKTGEASLSDAMEAYQKEVVDRGAKAVLGSLEDAKANMQAGAAGNKLASQGIKPE